jgi:hypothetical protein
MDFSSLTQKIKEATKPLMEKANPLFAKAKDVGYKALEFTEKQLRRTPLVLKSHDELVEIQTNKRCILICYDEKDASAREILLRSPIWAAKAFSDIAELRFLEVGTAPAVTEELGVNTRLDMRVWYIGEMTFHSTGLEEILAWWDTRCYDGKTDRK